MFTQITADEMRQRYPAAPGFSMDCTQLLAVPEELVCVASVDTSPTMQQRRSSGRPYFLSPEFFIWVPGNSAMSRMNERHQLDIAEQLFERHAARIHVFARHSPLDDWYDFGIGHRSGIRGSGPSVNEISVREIYIRLVTKLPEPIWLLFGGRPGLRLTINSVERETNSSDAVLHAIRDAWDKSPVDVEIGRYAGDTLFAIVDGTGRATVSHFDGRDEHVSRATQPLPLDELTYIFPRSDGHDHEVPVDQVIQRGEALSLIQDFVLNGSTAGLSPLG